LNGFGVVLVLSTWKETQIKFVLFF